MTLIHTYIPLNLKFQFKFIFENEIVKEGHKNDTHIYYYGYDWMRYSAAIYAVIYI